MFSRWASIARARGPNRRGSGLVEFALIAPWFVFLFIGAFDYGFYAYSMIATQNAARVAALYCSASNSRASACSDSACTYALGQLASLPNVGTSMTTCSSPVVVTATLLTGASVPDGAANGAAQVTVTYTSPNLIPIPGLLPSTLTVSRTVVMRVLT